MPARMFTFIKMLSFILLSPVHIKSLNCVKNRCWESRAAIFGWKKRKESRDHVWCQQMWINEEWQPQARGSTLNSARWSAWLRFQTITQRHAVVGALCRAWMTNVTSFSPVCDERDACAQTHITFQWAIDGLHGRRAEAASAAGSSGLWEGGQADAELLFARLLVLSHVICSNTGCKPHGFCRSWCFIAW